VEEPQPQAVESEAPPEPKSEPEPEKEEEFSLSNPRSVEKHGNELTRDKLTEIYDAEGKIIASYPVSEAVDRMEELDSGDTIITGGVISQRLIDVAFKKGVKNIYGAKLGHITKKPMEVKVVSWERHI
jgi:DNA primase